MTPAAREGSGERLGRRGLEFSRKKAQYASELMTSPPLRVDNA